MVNRHFKNMLLLFLCAILVISPQILHHSLILGADSLFHFNRFYDTAAQINDHNWQHFVSMYGFSQSGRIVNALYGPFIAYFNGLILWLVRSWFSYQIISDFILLLLAGASMYYLVIQNQVKNTYQILISALYMLSYGIVTWITGQQFLSWGAAILPLGLAAATRLVRNKNVPVNIIEMTLSVTLMIQTHVLSSLLLIVVLGIFFIVAFFQTNNRKALINNTIIAALFTILLTANIWGGLLEVYSSTKIVPPFYNETPQTRGSVSFPVDNLKLFFPYVLLYGYQILTLIRHWHHVELTNRLVTAVGGVSLILTLSIFPWNAIFKIPFISMLQFPTRFLPTATVLLLLGLGLTLTHIAEYTTDPLLVSNLWRILLIGALALIMIHDINFVDRKASVWQTPKVLVNKNKKVHQVASAARLQQSTHANKRLHILLDNVWKTTPDYLPISTKGDIKSPYKKYGQQIADKQPFFNKYVKNNKLYVAWEGSANHPATINVIKYPHTRLKLNNQLLKRQDYELTDIGAVKVHSKVGHNILQLSYQPDQWFTYLMIMTKIVWLLFAFYLIRFVFKYRQYNYEKNKKVRLNSRQF